MNTNKQEEMTFWYFPEGGNGNVFFEDKESAMKACEEHLKLYRQLSSAIIMKLRLCACWFNNRGFSMLTETAFTDLVVMAYVGEGSVEVVDENDVKFSDQEYIRDVADMFFSSETGEYLPHAQEGAYWHMFEGNVFTFMYCEEAVCEILSLFGRKYVQCMPDACNIPLSYIQN